MLDAYARRSDVTRIPEDVSAHHMEDLPWRHKGHILDNPQQAIFEAGRRYLVDRERDSGEVGSTWMLTSDVNEFLWFIGSQLRGRPTQRTLSRDCCPSCCRETARRGASGS